MSTTTWEVSQDHVTTGVYYNLGGQSRSCDNGCLLWSYILQCHALLYHWLSEDLFRNVYRPSITSEDSSWFLESNYAESSLVPRPRPAFFIACSTEMRFRTAMMKKLAGEEPGNEAS